MLIESRLQLPGVHGIDVNTLRDSLSAKDIVVRGNQMFVTLEVTDAEICERVIAGASATGGYSAPYTVEDVTLKDLGVTPPSPESMMEAQASLGHPCFVTP